mmetsp:Transcript_16150/g.49058  ORF Transcript_16150/g.49058 Transcript_16150/m.49058 type:complete len:106 (+) Transcript_16150:95-412(+)|eukprot:scaffold173560_cov27-Tisochrysis_lutea.AAC.1
MCTPCYCPEPPDAQAVAVACGALFTHAHPNLFRPRHQLLHALSSSPALKKILQDGWRTQPIARARRTAFELAGSAGPAPRQQAALVQTKRAAIPTLSCFRGALSR